MYIPITSGSSRVWLDVGFEYQKRIYAKSDEEALQYLIKNVRVDAVLTEDLTPHLTRAARNLIKDGGSLESVIERISDCFGVPASCVEEVIAPEVATIG